MILQTVDCRNPYLIATRAADTAADDGCGSVGDSLRGAPCIGPGRSILCLERYKTVLPFTLAIVTLAFTLMYAPVSLGVPLLVHRYAARDAKIGEK